MGEDVEGGATAICALAGGAHATESESGNGSVEEAAAFMLAGILGR